MPATPSEGWPDARPGNPLELIRAWYEEAVAAGLFEPDAMALATASPDGMPSVRIVLLKGIDDRGLRFFTNYGSRKGRELDANPRAAVTIHWATMHRAVRAEGAVERLDAEESDAYFASRGRESRLGAWASRQGTPIPDRATLEAAFADASARYPGDDVPRPEYWGGYRLVPDAIELWQGRPNRLHDREHFLREPGGGWRSERLSP
jgi:pyridoxamine 5'-phosphate oxidase